jgi:hypothetical protein
MWDLKDRECFLNQVLLVPLRSPAGDLSWLDRRAFERSAHRTAAQLRETGAARVSNKPTPVHGAFR